jgi:hypothetical protein
MVSNMTLLGGRLLLEDFADMLCRLAVSDLWVLQDTAAAEGGGEGEGEVPAPGGDAPEDTTTAATAAAAAAAAASEAAALAARTPAESIVERLGPWLSSYKQAPVPPVAAPAAAAVAAPEAPTDTAAA